MTVSLIFVAGRIEKLFKSRGGGGAPHGILPVLDRVPPCGLDWSLLCDQFFMVPGLVPDFWYKVRILVASPYCNEVSCEGGTRSGTKPDTRLQVLASKSWYQGCTTSGRSFSDMKN